MPFGLASATQCLARVTKPICAHLASKGIRHSLYIDDGKINAVKGKIARHLRYTLDVLKSAGFVVAPKKTDTAGTDKEYLGFNIDLASMKIRARSEKFEALRSIKKVIDEAQGWVKAKMVAKLIGKAILLQPALGPVVQLLTRSAQAELAAYVEEKGWKGKLQISKDALRCVTELKDSLEDMNSQAIKNMANAVTLESVIGPAKQKEAHPLFGEIRADRVVAGNASNKAVCSYAVRGLEEYFLQDMLSPAESKLSSGHRELLTVLRTLEKKKDIFESLPAGDRSILWLTDSTNMVAFLSKCSTKKDIQMKKGSFFYLRRYDERSRDYQSCCCDIFLTFSFFWKIL